MDNISAHSTFYTHPKDTGQHYCFKIINTDLLPEGDGANGVIVCVVDRQEVKRLILLLVRILVLLLRELTVIQEA